MKIELNSLIENDGVCLSNVLLFIISNGRFLHNPSDPSKEGKWKRERKIEQHYLHFQKGTLNQDI